MLLWLEQQSGCSTSVVPVAPVWYQGTSVAAGAVWQCGANVGNLTVRLPTPDGQHRTLHAPKTYSSFPQISWLALPLGTGQGYVYACGDFSLKLTPKYCYNCTIGL